MLSVSIVLLFSIEGQAQTGACCVDMECLDTMDFLKCLNQGGIWYAGEDCGDGFECPTGFPCGSYVPGDFNGNGIFNIADLTEVFHQFVQPRYPWLPCECPPGSGNVWYIRMDLNNSCDFNLSDIITGYSFLETGSPALAPCELCPPY